MFHVISGAFKPALIVLSTLVWIGSSQSAYAQTFDLDAKKKKTSGEATQTNLPNTDHLPKLDVIVPVFDPNIPKKDKDEIWPELRRAEANRFALMTKQALERTKAFGAVRVTPDDSGFGEIYVHGKILKANGEDVKLEIVVNDIRGKKKRWLKKQFKHRVQPSFFNSPRTKGTDAYAPIFEEIAYAVVVVLAKKKEKHLRDLPAITQMRFANMFGSDYFRKYIKAKGGSYRLVAMPDDNDPAYVRIREMRVAEQLFVDDFQVHYEAFSGELDPPYFVWQEVALPIAREIRKRKAEATASLFLGIAAIGAGAVSGDGTAAAVGVAAGGALIFNSVKEYRTANESSKVLDEMGKTLNLDLAEQVIEFEGHQTSIEGDAVEQFIAYRIFMVELYKREATPDVEL